MLCFFHLCIILLQVGHLFEVDLCDRSCVAFFLFNTVLLLVSLVALPRVVYLRTVLKLYTDALARLLRLLHSRSCIVHVNMLELKDKASVQYQGYNNYSVRILRAF